LGDAAPAADATGPRPVTASAGGERRHLTVLFCDLVGSTEIAAQLDPEEWREVVSGYHHTAAEAITGYGGHVAKYLGDGVMAYFGWPQAHENDAERATRAGLAIVERVSKVKQDPTQPTISVRVGIDSGTVVIGDGAGRDTEVFGETPNIAARVQSAAGPDSVLITAATHRLLSGLFVVQDAGSQQLKGVASPVELYRVLRLTGVRGRLATARELTPFVGREEELRLLLSRWERAREREGQLVLVVGEAGIGKSRLVAEFHDRIRDTPHIWMESAGEQFFENSPFHVVARMLSQWLELQGGTNLEDRAERLKHALASAGLKPDEAAPLIAEMLQLPVLGRYPAMTLTPEQRRRRLLATLTEWVFGAARLQPVVMVIEDLHWLDPSTLELEQLLAEQGPTIPLMLLYTARPEFRPQWPLRTHHTQINLNRLSARNVREMIAQVAARDVLMGETVDTVIECTGGVPLFVEELTHAVLESGSAKPAGREIPVTLHDSLMARLDRLGPAKEVIQIGAMIGGEFSYELLHAVHPVDAEELQSALRSATDAELVYVRGIAPEASYQFKHALIRDAAYEALLKSRRKQLHGRIAEVLVEQFPDRVTLIPELLAHHYTEAGLIEEGIRYWQRAGRRASERSANTEAISHFSRGLELLKSVPDSGERTERELRLQIALGESLMAVKGYAAPEVGKAYAQALELCGRVGETIRLFPVIGGLAAYNMIRGELRKARELLEQLLRLAQNQQSPELLQVAHWIMGEVLLYLGELPDSRTHLERAIALDDPHRRHLSPTSEPGVSCRSIAAVTLLLLGYPDQALKRIQESLTLAQDLSHPFSLSFALNGAAWVYQLCGEVAATQEHAEALIKLSREHGFMLREAAGVTFRGWALAKQGRTEEEIAQIRQGLAADQATGAGLWRPGYLPLLADACKDSRQPEQGLTALTEAFDLARRIGWGLNEPWSHQLEGELLLMKDESSTTQTESCFRRAIEIARKQSAKSLELRATTSLARLVAGQGRRDEARAMLAQIYGWFTEGFDIAGLKEARALLDELAT
jgi:class 3 adenylate cyclase/predicted ATPase